MSRGSPRRSEQELFRALDTSDDPANLAEFSERLRLCTHWVLNRMASGHGLWGEVDEIVDDALLRLEPVRRRGFTGNAPQFKAYLYRAVVSACMEAAKRQRLMVSLDAPVTLPDGDEKPLAEVLHEMVASALAVDVELERAEERDDVNRALAQLDERCQNLLRRFYRETVPIRELARGEVARANTIEVALKRCRDRLFAAFLSLYIGGVDVGFKKRVADAAERLSFELRRIFQAWWTENRSVLDISKGIGLSPAETKRLLAKAKLEVGRLLSAGGAA